MTGERAGDGVPNLSNPRQCALVSGQIWRGCLGFRPDLVKSSRFPAETHARHLSLAGTERDPAEIHGYSGRFSLPLTFSVAGQCAWVTDLSSSLSFSVAVRISLPLSFSVTGRRMNRSNIKKLIQSILISFNIKKIINIKNNRNRKKKKKKKKKKRLVGFGQIVQNCF
jgi:hypothetical protein